MFVSEIQCSFQITQNPLTVKITPNAKIQNGRKSPKILKDGTVEYHLKS